VACPKAQIALGRSSHLKSGRRNPIWSSSSVSSLPRLGTVPLAEIMAAAGCCKASVSDYRRGKRTPHVSTWAALASASEGCNT
jgi:hypothetical protein